eukprot:scaffold193563_cov29-Tisochrysis_lutea.AAC.5
MHESSTDIEHTAGVIDRRRRVVVRGRRHYTPRDFRNARAVLQCGIRTIVESSRVGAPSKCVNAAAIVHGGARVVVVGEGRHATLAPSDARAIVYGGCVIVVERGAVGATADDEVGGNRHRATDDMRYTGPVVYNGCRVEVGGRGVRASTRQILARTVVDRRRRLVVDSCWGDTAGRPRS